MAPLLNTTDLDLIFRKLDKNGDGLVSLDELMWLLDSIGCHTSLDELKSLVGKTSLDYVEFLFFYDIIIKGDRAKTPKEGGDDANNNDDNNEITSLEDDLQKAFGVFDLNGDGFISSEELQSALLKLGLWDDEHCGKDCRAIISSYDTNSDGQLDFEEFKNMMLLSS